MAVQLAVQLTGEWQRRGSGKFWHLTDPTASPDVLADRTPNVVAVWDPRRKDYRLKVFVKSTITPPLALVINGHAFNLSTVVPHNKSGFLHQGMVDGVALYRCLHGQPPLPDADQVEDEEDEEDEEEDAGGYLDVCIESRFELEKGKYARDFIGEHKRCPSWMKAWKLHLTVTNQYVWLEIGGRLAHNGHIPPCIRINDVWCGLGMPLGTDLYAYAFDPIHLEAISSWGQGAPDDDIALPNEPCPPRGNYPLRDLARLVGMGVPEHREWRKHLKDWTYSLPAMGTSWGQGNFYREYVTRNTDKAAHYRRCIQSQFNKRPPAYRTYDLDAWIDEVGGKPKEWRGKVKVHEDKAEECAATVKRHKDFELKARAKHDTALAWLEEHEAKYADAIRHLFPARD